jgi:hypothetical protein
MTTRQTESSLIRLTTRILDQTFPENKFVKEWRSMPNDLPPMIFFYCKELKLLVKIKSCIAHHYPEKDLVNNPNYYYLQLKYRMDFMDSCNTRLFYEQLEPYQRWYSTENSSEPTFVRIENEDMDYRVSFP